MIDTGPHTPIPSGTSRRPARARYLWVLFAAALAVIPAFLIVDSNAKAADIAGYCPEDCAWTLFLPTAGRFWERLVQTHAFAKLRDQGVDPFEAWSVDVRKSVGIRPTPDRWPLWLGDQLLMARSAQGIGYCTHPGLLLRALSAIHQRFAEPESEDMYRYGVYVYGWREGYLVYSKSAEYVRAALGAQPFQMEEGRPSDGARIAWNTHPRGRVTVHSAKGFPVEGWVRMDVTPRVRGLELASSWPEKPTAYISGARPEELAGFVEELLKAVPHGENLQPVWDLAYGSLPENWSDGIDEYTVAILDTDVSQTVPVPEIAMLLRGPRIGLDAPDGVIPYEWGGRPGWLRPWLGEKLALCSSATEDFGVLASQESLMWGLMDGVELGTPLAADLMVHVDWKRAGRLCLKLLRALAGQELIPRMNEADLNRLVTPYLNALVEMGNLNLVGLIDGQRLFFKGTLVCVECEEGADS